jgi:hypothetical protein
MIYLIKKATENQIEPASDLGKLQTAILLSYLPLIEFVSTASRKVIAQIVFKKLCVEQAPKNSQL